WGGLKDQGNNLWNSSQVPKNLLFGTSETNSVMVRYIYPLLPLCLVYADLSHLIFVGTKRLGKICSTSRPGFTGKATTLPSKGRTSRENCISEHRAGHERSRTNF